MDIFIILSLLAIFLGGLVRTYFGFGEALISMPLLALIGLETHTTISLVGLAGLFVASLNIFSDYRSIKYSVLFIMLAGSLVGIPIGIWILRYFNTDIVQIMLGGFLIIYGTYALSKYFF
ncbi:TSUP family transporter [Staphylococcus shinii]